ncbi:Stage II sporulation protein E (SpoIIE) [Nocardioides scoriae]|uniref:Stage II sporulation protein E (SpoIIE) n=1 Tax=Nocardioides scoriae TaxID=642780 RepID=A0A1H1RC70_9ACTN|nr:PP2C family protein-serine/threonine phosphatase [Nocardioides scoriae]SDS33387.1 Stage II sporulation protein E (SpoIIE) [Nocardioides scoriae]
MATVTTLSTRVHRYLTDPVATWRTGSRESQTLTLVALLVGVTACFAVSLTRYPLMPLTSYYVWLLLGMLLLRFRPLVVLSLVATTMAVTAMVVANDLNATRVTAILNLVVSVGLVLFASSRQHSGLPGPLSEAMLTDLRRRLQASGTVPPLPHGWTSQSAMLASNGIGYGGDFLVADLTQDGRRLEMILVDVCGKGVGAAAQALQFGGALGGLIGSLPPQGLFEAANDFLLRQGNDESFSTAVHVTVDLETGDYLLTSAGHPPALVWWPQEAEWRVAAARGTALGILPQPEMHTSTGTLGPGQALMFYTDGVIEYRSRDLDVGLQWLRERGASAVADGFDGAAGRLLSDVRRGEDDRAVLILHRATEPATLEQGVPESRPTTS